MKNFNYFYNGLSPSFLKFLWTFEEQGDTSIAVDESLNGSFNGLLTGTPYTYSDLLDLTDDTYAQVESGGLINQKSFTVFLDFQRYGAGTTSFLSTLESGGSSLSGLAFGWTDNHKIWVKALKSSTNEHFCYTFSENLAARNIVALKKSNNNISLYIFDPSYGDIVATETVAIPSDFSLESSSIILGNPQDFQSILGGAASYAYIHQMAWLGGGVSDAVMRQLFSGMLEYDSFPTSVAGPYAERYNNIEVIGSDYDSIPLADLTGIDTIFNSGFSELSALSGGSHFKTRLIGSNASNTLSYSGPSQKILNNLKTVNLGTLSGSGSDAGPDCSFTGDFEYSINSNNDVVFAAQIIYNSSAIGPITFNKETYGSGVSAIPSGSLVKSTIDDDFKMSGITITNYEIEDYDTLALEIYDDARPIYFNLFPSTGLLNQKLLVVGEPSDFYENRILTEDYTYASNKVTMDSGLVAGAIYYYDVSHGQSINSSGTTSNSYTVGSDGVFFKNSSVVKTVTGGNLKRLLKGIDYEETGAEGYDFLYGRTLANPSGTNEIINENSTYWQNL